MATGRPRIPGLAGGDNSLWVTNGDNCPVVLSVIIDALEIPVMHPIAATVGVLGVGMFGFGGLLRRNTARL